MRKVRKSPSKGRSERPPKEQLSPGMVSHLQAKYAMLCAQAIAEADLQQSLAEKPGMSKAELIAADLVLQFLHNKSLDMTAQTLKAEAGYAIDRSFGNRWIARQLEVRGREKVLNGLLVLKREGRFHIGLRKRRESAEPLAIEDATSMRERRLAIKGRKAMKRQKVPAERGKTPRLPRRPKRAMEKVPSPVPVEVEPVEEDVFDEEIFGSSDIERRRGERESDEEVDRSNKASSRSKSSSKNKKRGGRDESESDEDLNRSRRSNKSSSKSKKRGGKDESESDSESDEELNRSHRSSKSSSKSKKRGRRDESDSESEEDLNRSRRSNKSSSKNTRRDRRYESESDSESDEDLNRSRRSNRSSTKSKKRGRRYESESDSESDEDLNRSRRSNKSSSKSKKRGRRYESESESDEDLNRSRRSSKSSKKKSDKSRSKRGGTSSDSEMSSSQLSRSSKRSEKGKSSDRRRDRESGKKRTKRGSDEWSESSSISDIEAKKRKNDDKKAKTTPEFGKKAQSEGDRKSKTAADIFNKKHDKDSASTISTGSRASKKSAGSQLQRTASSDSDSDSHFSEKHRKVQLSGSFGSDKRSKGDAVKGDASRVDSYAHFPTSIASAIAGAIIAERGLTNVGCQAQSTSASTSKARSQIIDSSVGVSTEALETVPLKFNSDIVKPPEPEKVTPQEVTPKEVPPQEVTPQKDSDSECSHTYTYEYETVEVSGSDNYMYNSDEGGVYNRELKLPMPISPICAKAPFNVHTDDNGVLSVTVSRSRSPDRQKELVFVEAPAPPIDIRPANQFVLVHTVDIPPGTDNAGVKPVEMKRKQQEMQGVDSISNVRRLNTMSALSSLDAGQACTLSSGGGGGGGKKHRHSSEFNDDECDSLTFTGIFDQLSIAGDRPRGPSFAEDRMPVKEFRRRVDIVPEKPIMRPVEMPLTNLDTSSTMMSSAFGLGLNRPESALLRVHVIEADTGRRCVSKVRVGMRGVKLVAETDAIAGTSMPQYDELFNVVSMNRLKDRLKIALYVDNKKYGHTSIPVRQFPVMTKTEKWIVLRPFGKVRISVMPDVSETMGMMSSAATELMETGSLQFNESSMDRADKRMRDVSAAEKNRKVSRSSSSSSLKTSSVSLEDDLPKGKDFAVGKLALAPESSDSDM